MKRIMMFATVGAVLLVAAGASFQASQQTVEISSVNAQIRAQGNVSADLVATLLQGSKVSVVDASSVPGWTRVRVEGWVQSASLTTTQAAQPAADDPIVYITRTGTKYHRAGCRYLSQSSTPVRLSEAKRRGLTACSVCKPPPVENKER